MNFLLTWYKIKKINLVILLLSLAAIYLTFLRFEVSISRYMDADEYAYLSWGRMLSVGKIPYLDFFFFIPPGFLIFIAPFYWVFHGISIITSLRIFMFIIFVLLNICYFVLFKNTKNVWVGLVSIVVLLVLPMPFDKFIEIRPDTLAFLLLTIGTIFQLLSMRKSENKNTLFLMGLFYSMSLFVLPKSIGQVFISFVLYLFYIKFWQIKDIFSLKKIINNNKQLIIGSIIIPSIFIIFALLSGKFSYIFYSVLIMPSEIMNLGKLFYMSPTLFFYPNYIFYGADGWNIGLVANSVIWLIGIFWGTTKLFASGLYAKSRESVYKDLLIGLSFFINTFFYVQVYSLRHTQYLIPQAFFVAFYIGDLFFTIYNKFEHKLLSPLRLIGTIIFVLFFINLYNSANSLKLTNSNYDSLKEIKYIWSIIPEGSNVLDLDGRLIYYNNSHPVCCMPYGQFEPFLTIKPETIRASLEKNKTKYIFQGSLERINTLSWEDQNYIYNNYKLIYDKSLWERIY